MVIYIDCIYLPVSIGIGLCKQCGVTAGSGLGLRLHPKRHEVLREHARRHGCREETSGNLLNSSASAQQASRSIHTVHVPFYFRWSLYAYACRFLGCIYFKLWTAGGGAAFRYCQLHKRSAGFYFAWPHVRMPPKRKTL